MAEKTNIYSADLSAPDYDCKYLIRDSSDIYTVENGALQQVKLEVGHRQITDVTVEAALWCRMGSPLAAVRDTGNARAFVFPIEQGETYRIILTAISDRCRIITTTDNPRTITAGQEVSGNRIIANATPEQGAVYVFTAAPGENWAVYHASAIGETPETTIEFEISALVNAFISKGLDAPPQGELLKALNSPEVLYWQDSQDELPSLTATITGTPQGHQEIISEVISLADVTGIESAVCDCSGSPFFTVAFGSGGFMIYENGIWAAAGDAGMTADALQAVPAEAWQAAIAGVDTIQIKGILTGTDDIINSVILKFTH